jgi:exopolysaccharide biosynthesis protein
MDTLITQPNDLHKILSTTLNVSIVLGVLFSQHISGLPILAQEQFKIANSAVVAPFLNSVTLERNIKEKLVTEEQLQQFEVKIRQKYRTGVITNVDKGVKRIQILKYYQGQPVRINVIEVNQSLNPNLQLTPELASNKLGKKNTITTIAKNNNSIVAINGTFFKPSTGVPLGTLMINKKMYTGPIHDRVAMGIFDNGYDMARIQLNADIKAFGKTLKVDNINQPRTLSTHVIVYTADWGAVAPASPKYGEQIAFKDGDAIEVSSASLAIPENGFVVVGPAQQLEKFKNEKNVKLEVSTIPNWDNVNHIISGGPYLVRNSQVFVDTAEQKLGAIGGKNPRTAIGYTSDNDLIIVTVDGREEASVGMTLNELANFMKSIGCYNAMNLDGGGSTVLYVNGKVVNHPKVQGGIALSNALTLNRIN